MQALEIADNIKAAYEYIQANADFDSLWKPMDDIQSLGGFEIFIQSFLMSESRRMLVFKRHSRLIITENV